MNIRTLIVVPFLVAACQGGTVGRDRKSGFTARTSSITPADLANYDVAGAVAWADANWNNNDGTLCAGFTSNATIIGGHLPIVGSQLVDQIWLQLADAIPYDEYPGAVSACAGDIVFYSDTLGPKWCDPTSPDQHNCGHVGLVVQGGDSVDNILGDFHNNSHYHFPIGAILGGSYITLRVYHTGCLAGHGGARGRAMTLLADGGNSVDVLVARGNGSSFGGLGNGLHADGYGWAGMKPIAGDFDGDGNLDVGVLADSGGGVDLLVALGNGSGFGPFGVWMHAGGYGWAGMKAIAGDFDGDGKSDFGVLADGGQSGVDLVVARSTGSSFYGFAEWMHAGGYGFAGIKTIAGDFDGDGRWDVGIVADAGQAGVDLLVARSTGSSFYGFAEWMHAGGYGWAGMKTIAGDFDGDGRWDVGILADGGTPGSDLLVARSTGASFYGFAEWLHAGGYGWSGMTPVAGDFDGDGKWDVGVVADAADGSDLLVARSTGGSFGGFTDWLHASGYGWTGLKPVSY